MTDLLLRLLGGGMERGPIMALGQITAVAVRAGNCVSVNVVLHLYGGDATGGNDTARCRFYPFYAGVGYGDYRLPDIGTTCLCLFPGISSDGGLGGDVDDGIALGFHPSRALGIPAGLGGVLAANRHVYVGRPATAHDRHLQGDLVEKIDGVTTRTSQGDVSETLGGKKTLSVAGDVLETLSAKRTASVSGDESQMNSGKFKRSITGDAEWDGAAQLILKAMTNLILSGLAGVQITSTAGSITLTSGSNTLVITLTSITLTVGSTVIALTSSGITLNGAAITLAGLLTLPVGTHTHISGSPGVATSVPVAPGTAW